MATRREIKEADLLESARCLLRAPERIPYLPPMDDLVAEAALGLTLRESFQTGEFLTASRIRVLYEEAFRQTAKKLGYKAQPAEWFSKDAIRLAKTWSGFLAEYAVLQPVTPYVLHLGRAAIRGEYAIVQRRARRDAPWAALRFWRTVAPVGESDVINYARFLHLRHLIIDPQQEGGILHLDGAGLVTGEIPPEARLRAQLTFLAGTILNFEKGGVEAFPSPGAYCAGCHTKACLGRSQVEAPDVHTLLQAGQGA